MTTNKERAFYIHEISRPDKGHTPCNELETLDEFKTMGEAVYAKNLEDALGSYLDSSDFIENEICEASFPSRDGYYFEIMDSDTEEVRILWVAWEYRRMTMEIKPINQRIGRAIRRERRIHDLKKI